MVEVPLERGVTHLSTRTRSRARNFETLPLTLSLQRELANSTDSTTTARVERTTRGAKYQIPLIHKILNWVQVRTHSRT